MLHHVLSRYDRKSLYAWGAVYVLYAVVFLVWEDLVAWALRLDVLLAATWSFMALTLAWDVSPRRDLTLATVALIGGLVIEWWGTTTNLWHYYTAERPPAWILPAWPVAALSIDRVARMFGTLRAPPRASWLALPLFCAWMAHFAWPAAHVPSTCVIFALMLGVLVTARDLRQDVLLFAGGSALGVFLEYWGTSRACWTYYTGATPPLVAAFAHGFASVAFARGAALVPAMLPAAWSSTKKSP